MGALMVEGRPLNIENLDRVLYPAAGTTKAEVLDYYVRIAPVMLPHLRDRFLHMHRYPEGVGGVSFWEKQCPKFRPEWVDTAAVWSDEKNANIGYCVANDLPTLLWAVNIGSLELHTSLSLRADYERPTVIAFDLDPGPGTGLTECCEVALLVRGMLERLGLRSFPKLSGGKGLQVYVPLNAPDASYDVTKPFARRVAEVLEQARPDLVVSTMKREARQGRVLVDWHQNTPHKSMVCAYSLRARERPTASVPLLWEEVEGGDPPVVGLHEVPDRVARHGDLFAEVLTLVQRVA